MNFYARAGRVEPETHRILRIYTTVPCNSMTTAPKRSANFRLLTLWPDSGGFSVALAPRFSQPNEMRLCFVPPEDLFASLWDSKWYAVLLFGRDVCFVFEVCAGLGGTWVSWILLYSFS